MKHYYFIDQILNKVILADISDSTRYEFDTAKKREPVSLNNQIWYVLDVKIMNFVNCQVHFIYVEDLPF